MRLLLVQLSDMHCRSSDKYLTEKVEKAVEALSTLSPVDKAALVFSGDLTDSASKDQFEIGRAVLGKFLNSLGKKLNCGFINTLIVPGNHDMILPLKARSAHEINQWNKSEHLDEELAKLSSFFEYAKTKRVFESDKLIDVVTICLGKFNIQFCLINSAPFSTREKDDKELHYLPSYVGEKLSEPLPEHTMRVAICHHSYEWFDWNSKEMLKRALSNSDIVFFGHEHQAESLTITSGSGANLNIIMGGRFNLDCQTDSTFNALVFDTESLRAQRVEFSWNTANQIFISEERGSIQCMQPDFHPSNDYLSRLLMENEQPNTNLLEYFTFPRLIPTGKIFSDEGIVKPNAEDMFEVIDSEQVIKIVGGRRSGKTSLLRYLYSESMKYGYFPLLIEQRDYRDSRIEKMLKDMLELQYTCAHSHSYEVYEQMDHKKQIIFIDDIDLIQSAKARAKLVDYILSSGRLLIYSTKSITEDLEELVKERLQGKDAYSFEISPFFKESRDELVGNICAMKNRTPSEKAAVITALDYLIQCQSGFFSLDPGSLLQYVNYFLNEGTRESKGIETLSLVFETNTRNALITYTGGENITVVLSALEYLADYMYFTLRQESIDVSTYERIVIDFNQQRKAAINAKELLDICKKAHILQEEKTSFNIRFIDKNTFAYFVAKHISREYERDSSNLDKLSYVMNHICFGINDTIVLFLAFIRSNVKIILELAQKATVLLDSYPEWNFEKNNIPFLLSCSNPDVGVPTPEESKSVKAQTEIIEKERHELVKFDGIFDYSDEDANKEHFKVLTALKYAQLAGRALVDQYGSLNAPEIDQIVQMLYVVPQKVIYALMTPYQRHSSEIVDSIKKFVEEELPEERITEDDIRDEFARAGTALALNIMNDIAYNTSNKSTIIALRDLAPVTLNYAIMQLMMEENAGNTEEFVSKAIALRKMLNNPYAQTLVAWIARKHILYSLNIDHRQIDKLTSGHVLSVKSKKVLIAEQGSKAQK